MITQRLEILKRFSQNWLHVGGPVSPCLGLKAPPSVPQTADAKYLSSESPCHSRWVFPAFHLKMEQTPRDLKVTGVTRRPNAASGNKARRCQTRKNLNHSRAARLQAVESSVDWWVQSLLCAGLV